MGPREFFGMYLAANGFAIAVLLLAFLRPEAARWTIVGVFAWACSMNTWTALTAPEAYLNYAALTPSAAYREFILGWFSRHIPLLVVSIACGQAAIATLIASRLPARRNLGAAGAWVFLFAIAPLGVGSGFPFSLTFSAALYVALAPEPLAEWRK